MLEPSHYLGSKTLGASEPHVITPIIKRPRDARASWDTTLPGLRSATHSITVCKRSSSVKTAISLFLPGHRILYPCIAFLLIQTPIE